MVPPAALAALLLLCFPLFGQQEHSAYTLLYTGNTFGYYRVPDRQTTASRVCAADAGTLAQVNRFLETVRSVSGQRVLVGMGDNFSPELNARVIFDESSKSLVPKDQVPGGAAEFDNVACFFRLAGFDAMVPGRQDFHFGPERLRSLARYLAGTGPGGTPVQMLAANLAINTYVVDPPAKSPNPPAPQNYATAGENGASFRLPAIPLPYLRRFEIHNAVRQFARVVRNGREQLQRREGQDVNESGAIFESEILYDQALLCRGALGDRFDSTHCEALDRNPVASGSNSLAFSLPAAFPRYPAPGSIEPHQDYHLCASKAAKTTLCSATFQFHQPFFEHTPYVRLKDQPLVIFGIVDPHMLPLIGEMNYSWLNQDPRLNTQIEIADPREALNQLLETCDADPDCRGARRILLAQMPPADARRLADRLRGKFDVIVSAGNEAHATRDMLLTNRNEPQQARVPVVVTPGSHYFTGTPNSLHVTLQEAHLDLASTTSTLDNSLHRSTVPLHPRIYTGRRALSDIIAGANLAPVAPGLDGVNVRRLIETAVLGVMRRHCKADIAFLQHRDVFRPGYFALETPAPDELQTLLDQVLWKGDFIVCRAATGAVIRQVLAQSEAFDAADSDPSNEAADTGRGLARLGIFKDPATGDLIVGGSVLQNQALYSIATTDYIGLGDTGYQGFEVPVPPAQRLRDYGTLYEISAEACSAVIGAVPGSTPTRDYCRHPTNPLDYLDRTTLSPYSDPAQMEALDRLEDWIHENWAKRALRPSPHDKAESEAQNRRVLSLRLDRADIGFQQNLHSLSEAQQKDRFAGVQASQPTAPEKIDAIADWLLRLTSRGRNADYFVQTDGAYQASAIRQSFSNAPGSAAVTESFQLSQPKNSVALESGITWHLVPPHQKSMTGIRLLTSGRFETELASPFVQFQASDGFVARTLPRRNSIFGKAGLRYDGRQSWIEAGMQSGPFTQISSLTFGGLTCDPGSIANCVVPPGVTLPAVSELESRSFSVATKRRNQSGVFLNARIHLPLLLNRFDYVIDNSGALYFNRAGDSSADTRYLEVMTHSLTIPVAGNLSIAPRVDLFFFENKIAGWHIHGYQTSISAQYRFDWHTGLRLKTALKYPNPPPSGDQ